MLPSLLLVDDDDAIRTSLAGALADGTMDITQAASAEDAIRVLEQRGPPDVVLTDIRMRGLDGLDLLRIVRERAPASHVVIMTAYHDVGTAVTAMREGAADFLCKPFDLATVRDVLRRLLGGASGGDDPALSPRPSDGGADPPPTPQARTLAGRYELSSEVGRGAMARVFRARDVRHDRDVAVKILRPEVAASIGRDRFLQEIRITARLHHPHILTLIDSGEWEGAPFFVMPFVDGTSLRQTIDESGRLPVGRACSLLRDVADALAAAHAVGIVHRDVKPANVLLSDAHAWVADFGVARALRDAAGVRETMVGSVIGTPAYMAPEQGAGGGDVDHRADLYALGVVAYELLTGRLPFSGHNARAILTAHACDAPPPFTKWGIDLPLELEAVVAQCLAKAPDERPASARHVARVHARYSVEVEA